MIDLLVNPALTDAILQICSKDTRNASKRNPAPSGRYVQVININDDLGTRMHHRSRPESTGSGSAVPCRALPFIKERCDAAIFLHSDGAIEPLIPDLIDAGIDILNPIQLRQRMDPGELKRKYGRDPRLLGGGSIRSTCCPLAAGRCPRRGQATIGTAHGDGGFRF